jgi:hypothetical protein
LLVKGLSPLPLQGEFDGASYPVIDKTLQTPIETPRLAFAHFVPAIGLRSGKASWARLDMLSFFRSAASDRVARTF